MKNNDVEKPTIRTEDCIDEKELISKMDEIEAIIKAFEEIINDRDIPSLVKKDILSLKIIESRIETIYQGLQKIKEFIDLLELSKFDDAERYLGLIIAELNTTLGKLGISLNSAMKQLEELKRKKSSLIDRVKSLIREGKIEQHWDVLELEQLNKIEKILRSYCRTISIEMLTIAMLNIRALELYIQTLSSLMDEKPGQGSKYLNELIKSIKQWIREWEVDLWNFTDKLRN